MAEQLSGRGGGGGMVGEDGGGGGLLGAATAPLTFHDFLLKMRQPGAADLVRAIRSFILTFTSVAGPRDAYRDSSSVQSFLTATKNSIRAHPVWAGASEPALDAAGEGFEKYLMTKLHDAAFGAAPGDKEGDVELDRRMKVLQTFLKPEHLDIPARHHDQQAWLLAVNELSRMNQYKAPRDKLVCILNCCRVVTNLLNASAASSGSGEQHQSAPGADDFLPVLVYITVQANPQQLHSNLEYIARYRHAPRLASETAYFFTNLVSVEAFLLNLHAGSFSMDPMEFTRRMRDAGIEINNNSDDTMTNDNKADDVQRTPRAQPSPASQRVVARDPDAEVARLIALGAAVVVESGSVRSKHKYVYADAGDLTVGDAYTLLAEYKELVMRLESLTAGIKADMLNTPAESTAHPRAEEDYHHHARDDNPQSADEHNDDDNNNNNNNNNKSGRLQSALSNADYEAAVRSLEEAERAGALVETAAVEDAVDGVGVDVAVGEDVSGDVGLEDALRAVVANEARASTTARKGMLDDDEDDGGEGEGEGEGVSHVASREELGQQELDSEHAVGAAG